MLNPYLTIELAPKQNVKDISSNRMELNSGDYFPIITLFNPEEGTQEILEISDKLTITSLDDNIFVQKIYDSGDQDFLVEIKLLAVREGSAILNANYISGNISAFGQTEVVVYNPWFRDNYQMLIGEYDATLIGQDTYADCLLKSCLETYDIMWAYAQDIKEINDPMLAKSKFLETIGKSFGMTKTDFSADNTALQFFANQFYRELLTNLKDLLSIRGTALSYELFFGALGYDITLYEYWFNQDNYLVEINPYDDGIGNNQSTFFVYDASGKLVGDNTLMSLDPRGLVSSENPYNYCNKSCYIKPELTPKKGYEFIGGEFSASQRSVIKKYLTYLKPIHIEYLGEILNMLITSESFIPLMTDASQFNVTKLSLIAPPIFTNSLTNLYPLTYGPDEDFLDPLVNPNANPYYLPFNYLTKKESITKFKYVIAETDWNNPTNILDNENDYTDTVVTTESSTLKLSIIDIVSNDYTIYNAKPTSIYYIVQIQSTAATLLEFRQTFKGVSGDWQSAETYETKTLKFFNAALAENTTWDDVKNTYIQLRVKNKSLLTQINCRLYKVDAVISYSDADLTGLIKPGDPGRLDYDGTPGHGTLQQSGGGMAVDGLWRVTGNINDNKSWLDTFTFSVPVEIVDTIATIEKYDKKPPHSYDGGILKYDTGYMLLDSPAPDGSMDQRSVGIQPININVFQQTYNNLIQSGLSPVGAKARMLEDIYYKGLSDKNFEAILSYSL